MYVYELANLESYHEEKTELLNHCKHKEQLYLSIINFPCLFMFFENNIQSIIS